jgi:hypothetical protein
MKLLEMICAASLRYQTCHHFFWFIIVDEVTSPDETIIKPDLVNFVQDHDMYQGQHLPSVSNNLLLWQCLLMLFRSILFLDRPQMPQRMMVGSCQAGTPFIYGDPRRGWAINYLLRGQDTTSY